MIEVRREKGEGTRQESEGKEKREKKGEGGKQDGMGARE